MTKTIAQTYTLAHTYRRSITSMLIIASAICALFYLVNLYRVITHSLALQQIISNTKLLNASVQSLDSEYLSLFKTITAETIHEYGYDQAEVSAFIVRNSQNRVAIGRP